MRSKLLAVVVATASFATAAPPALAAGCIKGAIMGGVAGHYAGHGVLGAVGGCVVGRRVAKQQAERQRTEELQRQQGPVTYDGRVSPDPAYKRTRTDPQYDAQASRQYSGPYTGTAAQPGAAQNAGSPPYTGGAYRR